MKCNKSTKKKVKAYYLTEQVLTNMGKNPENKASTTGLIFANYKWN